jgi:hypothetical protein
MDIPPLPHFLELTVETRQDLDAILDAAVAQLIPIVMAESAGIGIARSGVGQCTVSVRNDIQFGTTIEAWVL